MAGTPELVSGGVTQISAGAGVGGSQPTPQGTGQPNAPQAGLTNSPQLTPSGWTVNDPELAEFVKTKGWKADVDAVKSYRELEKKFGEVTGNTKQLEEIVQAVAPHWDDFVAWKQAQADAQEADPAARGNKKAQTPDALLNERIKPLQDTVDQTNQRLAAFARQTASQRFEGDHKDAIEMKERILEILKSGEIRTTDPFDPNACYRTLVSAYNIAKSERADKAEKGKNAGRVEGGSGGESHATGNDMTLDQMRANLTQ